MAHTRSAAARPVHSQGIRLKVLRLRRPSVRKGSGSVKKHCWILDRDRLAAAKPAYAGVRMWPRVKRSEKPGTHAELPSPQSGRQSRRRSIFPCRPRRGLRVSYLGSQGFRFASPWATFSRLLRRLGENLGWLCPMERHVFPSPPATPAIPPGLCFFAVPGPVRCQPSRARIDHDPGDLALVMDAHSGGRAVRNVSSENRPEFSRYRHGAVILPSHARQHHRRLH